MLKNKPVGRVASSMKYDLLTALGTFALMQSKGKQVLCLRFMTLVTARYNWMRDELNIGQREIAQMWGVDERTVKREMAKLRNLGWLIVKRQGVRGRVTKYGIDLKQVMSDTQSIWEAVGPDFKDRMDGQEDKPSTNVIPLNSTSSLHPPSATDKTEWGLACTILYQQNPMVYQNWVSGLERKSLADGRLILSAPSKFHAHYVETHLCDKFLAIIQSFDQTVSSITISA